jgi:tetratricopeptide (TPR) repeat protein
MSIATTPLLLGLLAGAAAAGPAQEGLGARYHAVSAEAEAAIAAATAAVEGHLARVEPLEASETSRAYRAQVEPLVELGPAAVPALLTAMAAPLPTRERSRGEVDDSARSLMDDSGRKRAAWRSRVCAHALRGIASPLGTEPLLELVRTNRSGARVHALLALEATQEDARVTAALAPLLASFDNPPDRAALLATLAHLDGDGAREALRSALLTEDAAVAAATLDALAAVASASDEGRQRVLSLEEELQALMASPRGAGAARGLLALFRTVPEALDEDDTLEALVVMAHAPAARRVVAAEVLDTLRELGIKPPRRARSELKELQESRVDEVRIAALAWAASQKDGSARRKLLEPYDAAIERRPDSETAWMDRAEILYRIQDWGDALKDYEKALEESGRLSLVLRRATEAWVGVARCQARMGRFRDAARTLEDSPLTTTLRRGLANDPAFAEMLEEGDYRRTVFLLRDE